MLNKNVITNVNRGSKFITNFTSDYQRLWQYIRNILLIVGLSVTAAWSTFFNLPIWLWLMIEAVMRYFPFWFQAIVFLFLGLQIDFIFKWSLGTGLIYFGLFWLGLLVSRQIVQPIIFVCWQMVLISIFFWSWNHFLVETSLTTLVIMFLAYLAFLLFRIKQGKWQ